VFDFGGRGGGGQKCEERIKKRVHNFYLSVFFLKSQMWAVFIFSSNICGMSNYFQIWKKKERKM